MTSELVIPSGQGDSRHRMQGDCTKRAWEKQDVGKSRAVRRTRTSLLSLPLCPQIHMGLSYQLVSDARANQPLWFLSSWIESC